MFLLFSCNIENHLENLFKNFLIFKDVTLDNGCKDGRKRSNFCFNVSCIFFVNEMNPVILLSIICTWHLKISSLPKPNFHLFLKKIEALIVKLTWRFFYFLKLTDEKPKTFVISRSSVKCAMK